MSFAGAMWAPAAIRVLRNAVGTTSKMIRTKLAAATRQLGAAETQLQPIAIRSSGRQPIHPAALLRQSKRASSKWYSTSSYQNINHVVRRYISGGNTGPRFDRSKFPVSNTSRAVTQLTGRAPFASTLRPNLTGGALPRTAGGYSMPGSGRIGGQRYFSHTPTAPAQVVQNVSQAMRAFWLSGQRAQLDGYGPNGEKRYRAVNAAAEEARVRLASVSRSAPGSFIDFRISPTVTALSPLAAAFPFLAAEGTFQHEAGVATLNTDGLLDILSGDFARALKDLAAVMSDLKRLALLGDLPIVVEKHNTIRVRFPGVDADTVERLCDDCGVQRGLVGQDPDFDAAAGVPVALRFPFAPDATESPAKTMTSPGGSMRSHHSDISSIEDEAFFEEYEENPWLSSPDPEGYETMSGSPLGHGSVKGPGSEDYEGLEGIYRFLEECDRARRRF